MRQLNIIQDGALLIAGGKIQEVGPSRRVEMLAISRDAEEIDASGKVVMPGFVDCQTQVLCPPSPLDDYESRHLKTSEPAPEPAIPRGLKTIRGFSPQRLEMEGKRRLRLFTRYGTTTLGSSSGYGLDESTELRMLRVLDSLNERPLDIVRSFGGAIGVAPEFAERPLDYLDFILRDVLPLVQRRRLARFADISVGEGAFSAAAAARYMEEANRAGIKTFLHMTPGAVPVEGAQAVSGLWNLTTPMPIDETIAVLTPGRAFHEGVPTVEPARSLIDAGAAVALSTGFNSETSPSCSMPMTISLACNLLRMTPAEAITASTINAAYALDLGDSAGSLETGKWADLLMVNTGDYRDIPYQFGVNLLAMVMKRGEAIYPRLEAV